MSESQDIFPKKFTTNVVVRCFRSGLGYSLFAHPLLYRLVFHSQTNTLKDCRGFYLIVKRQSWNNCSMLMTLLERTGDLIRVRLWTLALDVKNKLGSLLHIFPQPASKPRIIGYFWLQCNLASRLIDFEEIIYLNKEKGLNWFGLRQFSQKAPSFAGFKAKTAYNSTNARCAIFGNLTEKIYLFQLQLIFRSIRKWPANKIQILKKI